MTLPEYYDLIVDEQKANTFYKKLLKIAKTHLEEWDLDELYNFCKQEEIYNLVEENEKEV